MNSRRELLISQLHRGLNAPCRSARTSQSYQTLSTATRPRPQAEPRLANGGAGPEGVRGVTLVEETFKNVTSTEIGVALPPISKYVAYFPVSTARQGQSGLGLEAQ